MGRQPFIDNPHPYGYPSPVKTASHAERKSATIKLGAFNGTNVPLETHLAKLRNCADYYGRDEYDRLCHLKASLEGSAAAILWELPSGCSEVDLLRILRNRYGNQEQIERFRFELRFRRRKKGETIQALHQDVCRLLALSYPGETGSLSRIVARDAFIDSLGDPEMRIRILEKDAKSIDEAYAIAARYEAYAMAAAENDTSEEGNRRRARTVNARQPATSTDSEWQRRMESSISALQTCIQSLLQQKPLGLSTVPSTGVRPPATTSYPPIGQLTTAMQPQPSYSSTEPPTSAATTTRANRRPNLPRRCYQCGGEDHLLRNCPVKNLQPPTVGLPTAAVPSATTTAHVMGAVSPAGESEAYLEVTIRQKGGKVLNVAAILDSGCNMSVIPAKYCRNTVRPADIKLYAANGTEIPVNGKARMQMSIEGLKLNADVLVSDCIDEFLLGIDFLRAIGCQWDFATGTVNIKGRKIRLRSRRSSVNIRRVYVADNVIVEKRSVANVPVKLMLTSLRSVPCNWLLEPKLINDSLLVARTLLSHEAVGATVRVVNPSDKAVIVKNGQ
jgi:predicted aspartyl protease